MDFLKHAAARGCAAAHSRDKNRQYGATVGDDEKSPREEHINTHTHTHTHTPTIA